MKYKILSALLILCLLVGCKVEFPAQTAASTASQSPVSSGSVSPQSILSESSAEPVSSAQSAVSSAMNSTASKAAESASPSQSKVPAASKPALSSAAPQTNVCTLSISCSDILDHKDKFTQEQLALIPADGIILSGQSVSIQSGDTVFDVLLRETKQRKIQMEHINSPAFQTEYIRSIGNIYERTYGSSSGWLFFVNGKQPAVGCSAYKLKSGDKIQWNYHCGE